MMRWLFVLLGAIWLVALPAISQPQSTPNTSIDTLTLYVPAAPGGGYDGTASALKRALIAEGLVETVDIIHSPGAGGLIGLAQFIESQAENPHALLICGRTTLGAMFYNRATVSLRDVTPIARLISPTITVIVPVDSPFTEFADLAEVLGENPELVTWYGGSAGSSDELVAGSIVEVFSASGQAPPFKPVPGGGDSIIDHLLSEDLAVAVSSFEEVSDAVNDGRVRILAVSAQRSDGQFDAPTLLDFGVNLPVQDWRAVFAPPGISADEATALSDLIAQLVESSAWMAEQNAQLWQDAYLAPAALAALIEAESSSIEAQTRPSTLGSNQAEQADTILDRRERAARFAILAIITLAGAVIVLFVFIRWQRQRWVAEVDEFNNQTRRMQDKLDKSNSGMAAHINQEFERWKLTQTENEIGWMLLKGLSFKEIATARGRSERTVRQQAQSIYAKSELQSRSDLAAHFLEDFVFGQNEPEQP